MYGYEDWTCEDIPRCFYVGIGNQARIKKLTRNQKHNNVANKHGLDRRIVFCSSVRGAASDWEIAHIDEMKTYHYDSPDDGIGCNFTRGGETFSPGIETRQKIGSNWRGRKHSKASREKMRLACLGRSRPCSEETKQKLRKRSSGWHHNEETRRRMAASARKRAPRSLETRTKMSNSMKAARARKKW